MNEKLPGTQLEMTWDDPGQISEQFNAMFLPGGMMLSQVSGITGLEPYTIQNWVKRGFLSPPLKKRYTLRQLCRIININMLKGVLPMERICSLLGYVNGQLDDESDDMIDDATLYFMFCRLTASTEALYNREKWELILDETMKDYVEPVPGAKERVRQVLRIMLTAWVAARVGREAEQMVTHLLENQ